MKMGNFAYLGVWCGRSYRKNVTDAGADADAVAVTVAATVIIPPLLFLQCGDDMWFVVRSTQRTQERVHTSLSVLSLCLKWFELGHYCDLPRQSTCPSIHSCCGF